MKKIILLFLCSLNLAVCFGQASVYLCGKNYDAVYSLNKKRPLLVYYELSRSQLQGKVALPLNQYPFTPNPAVPVIRLDRDFYHSGYDRAYMMPVADNSFDVQGLRECNYYTNIMAQTTALKRGPWKTEEAYERILARRGLHLTVLCGGIGSAGSIGEDKVDVPAECWKIVIMQDPVKHLADTIAYLFPNDNRYKSASPDEFEISCKDLEAKLGFEINDMITLHDLRNSKEQLKEILQNAAQTLDAKLNKKVRHLNVRLASRS